MNNRALQFLLPARFALASWTGRAAAGAFALQQVATHRREGWRRGRPLLTAQSCFPHLNSSFPPIEIARALESNTVNQRQMPVQGACWRASISLPREDRAARSQRARMTPRQNGAGNSFRTAL
jgi:hypothetical protein